MHKEWKKQRHAEEQGPAKNGGLEVMKKIKMNGCRKWACFHPRRKTFQLGVEVGPNQEMLFTALRDVRPGAAQLCWGCLRGKFLGVGSQLQQLKGFRFQRIFLPPARLGEEKWVLQQCKRAKKEVPKAGKRRSRGRISGTLGGISVMESIVDFRRRAWERWWKWAFRFC